MSKFPADSVTDVRLWPRTAGPDDDFVPFYVVVRKATEALGFRNYSSFITSIFCGSADEVVSRCGPRLTRAAGDLRELAGGHFCFSGTKAYDQLREATDLFVGCQAALLQDCCHQERSRIDADRPGFAQATSVEAAQINADLERERRAVAMGLSFNERDVSEINRRFAPESITLEELRVLALALFDRPAPDTDAASRPQQQARTLREDLDLADVLTFMRQLRENHAGVPLKDCTLGSGNCTGVLLSKLRCPPLLELIWSYWMEQGMLVQGINAITLRFQNLRPTGRDPLVHCDTSPLRPLNNILWGYVQNEIERLTVARRAYEYDHHYGLRLQGRAVPSLTPADSRSAFIEAFHRLLQEAARYYRSAMDTTIKADAFGALNSLREVHLLLAEGAHNQFGDLPTTARAEMLMQQWILARPETREFLPSRPGVPYPEAWMPQLETMRNAMGWSDTTIRHYRDLAVYGEQLLLSIRYLPWSLVNDDGVAAAWLVHWRPEVLGYLHSYRAVTGADLGAQDVRILPPQLLAAQPSDLIFRRRASLAPAAS